MIGRRLAQTLHYRKGDYKLILFMALCEPCLYFLFEAKAVENTTASQAGLITAMLPILVMIAAALILKERITGRSIAGSIVAVFGVCWLTLLSSPTADAPNPLLGNFLEFLAMVCATGYTIALKSLTERYAPFFLTAMQAFAGCLFLFSVVVLSRDRTPDRISPWPCPGHCLPRRDHYPGCLRPVQLRPETCSSPTRPLPMSTSSQFSR